MWGQTAFAVKIPCGSSTARSEYDETQRYIFVLALLPWGLRQIREAARSVASPDSVEGKDRPLAMLLERTAQALVILGALAYLAQRWGVDSMHAMMAAEEPGAMALRAALRIVLTLIVVDLLWHLGRALIDHHLSRSTATMSATDATRQARLRTLLPLFRNAYFVTLAHGGGAGGAVVAGHRYRAPAWPAPGWSAWPSASAPRPW